MSEAPNVVDSSESGGSRPHHHPLVVLLAVVIFIEAAALYVATATLIIELLIDRPDSYASALALTVCTVIAAIWVTAIAINTLRGRAWIRGAAIVVQVLLAAVALGSFQGVLPRADIGWLLLFPAIVVMVLLFTKPVLAATSARGE